MAPPRPKTNIHIYVVINSKTEKKKITCKATAIFSYMDGSFLIRVIKSLAKGPKFWQVSVG